MPFAVSTVWKASSAFFAYSALTVEVSASGSSAATGRGEETGLEGVETSQFGLSNAKGLRGSVFERSVGSAG